MKLSFQSPQYCVPSYLLILFLFLSIHFSSMASTLVACSEYECEDLTLVKSLPHTVDLADLTGEFCSFLSFTPDSLNHSFLITQEGITEYTVYHLLTGDSCTAIVEIVCSVICPEDSTIVLDFEQDTISLQASSFSLESCYLDEVFLSPYEMGFFTEGLHEVVIYSPSLDVSCVTQLNVSTTCHFIECNNITSEYYNTTIWPQRILEYPCSDTMAFLMEILDENEEVIVSGNSVYLDESFPDTVEIRIIHIETGNSCTSELRLFHNCLQYAKDTISLDFTDLESIIVPWDSLFTIPCEYQYSNSGSNGTGHLPQGDKITFLFEVGGYEFENSFQDAIIFYIDARTDSSNVVQIVFQNLSLGLVQGFVFQDVEGDCAVDTFPELGAENILVYAAGETDTFFTRTDTNGLFNFQIPEFHSYDIGMVEINNFWDICVNEPSIYLGENFETVFIGLSADTLCSYLTSYLAIPRFRRCFDNNIYIDYCNQGSDTAYDVTLDFYFDEGLEIDPEDYGFMVVDANHYQLDIGTLAPLECGELTVVAFVDCDLDFGTELCAEVELGPIPDCNDTEEWSGAALDVQGICDGDSVRFIITNIGATDMTGSQEFIVIEDDIMIIQDVTNLPEGESIELAFPANGSTYRLMADQEPFHPYTQKVSALVKACAEGSTGISTGFANSFILDEQAPYISIECMPVIGAYDPNDKAVTPTGAYENHIITGDEELEYMIRFENSGTDTAFNIRVVDTLDSNLDLFTFKLAGSSHPLEVEFPVDGIINFQFNNIELPDTSVNKLGAQGFVKYTIRPKQNLPLETKIYNSAGIYFDFNAPILTNKVDVQVGEYISTGLSSIPELISNFSSPNPTYAYLNIDMEFDQFIISNMNGMKLVSGGQASKIDVNSLSPGIYLISIYENNHLIGIDKFVKINLY